MLGRLGKALADAGHDVTDLVHHSELKGVKRTVLDEPVQQWNHDQSVVRHLVHTNLETCHA